jgi:hypothetical protein
MTPEQKLIMWAEAFKGTNTLGGGFSFPLKRGDKVTTAKPIRANRYVKRGETLTYHSLAFHAVLFQNDAGQWVKVCESQIADAFTPKGGAQ